MIRSIVNPCQPRTDLQASRATVRPPGITPLALTSAPHLSASLVTQAKKPLNRAQPRPGPSTVPPR
ncbi:hypothetical protein BDN67DRAFT_968484 [Paxillus ammoniavirescens]|nr:hypothetical protein BDN67DRAFT_968484 [Paxillus ammoniavirescens]